MCCQTPRWGWAPIFVSTRKWMGPTWTPLSERYFPTPAQQGNPEPG
jgi:hypothetical protein